MQTTDASTEIQSDSTLTQLREIIDRKPATIDVSETVQYFRRLARMPFVEASREKGMLLFLHDLDQPETIGFLHDTVAHTPYARAHKLQGLKHIQGASWTVYFSKDPSVEKMAMVSSSLYASVQLCRACSGAIFSSSSNNRCNLCG